MPAPLEISTPLMARRPRPSLRAVVIEHVVDQAAACGGGEEIGLKADEPARFLWLLCLRKQRKYPARDAQGRASVAGGRMPIATGAGNRN